MQPALASERPVKPGPNTRPPRRSILAEHVCAVAALPALNARSDIVDVMLRQHSFFWLKFCYATLLPNFRAHLELARSCVNIGVPRRNQVNKHSKR